ncbi:MAG: pyridoxal phosphate-dependent aminotransferase [Bacteroidales bacterium]|jgi:aspartate/methionine/tyrosine aminotransferase|nr:pyridoxal phosphate-dependent aminotransferase [Bacteroidales bacterium]MDI9593051.1 pyridoxal phosphate-dependent aminotransferase [Bacteroidota bacterium]NLH34154.1 pyridoxal phosphate-dependent aminotransferase [Lentimicrobium sp.]OQC37699.1 MAG: Aspartate aminotransferase [Bacteroidetes bacterium ADurb.Bin041]MBP7873202.1 pyridoxal phosphate-dependent aminotransferase [Bacteroidales bacterium]
MSSTPLNSEIVKQKIQENKIKNVGNASIREVKKLIDDIEKATGEKFVRMEMGVPGLPPTQIGIEAQKKALDKGVAAIYPDIFGIQPLKEEIARFVKNFIDLDVSVDGCLPTVGSMQGSFAVFMTLNRMHKEREGTLFLDPGFPVHKQQLRVMGQTWEAFDVYNYRGEKLRAKLESYLSTGRFCTLLYSNPNNPSWICFTDEELQIIGELATKYDVIVIEDLAYFAMDFRKDYSKPGVPPYQPTVAKYTENFVLLISSSKAFSYAGERIGMLVISDKIFHSTAPDLLRYYNTERVGAALIFGSIYSLSSGTSHSGQYALAAILKAANDGKLNFVEVVKEYGEKAKIMKKMFTDNGFKIVYDKDIDKPIADGFYFTFSYPGFTGAELLGELLYYGISAITLDITGSERTEGIRACVSLVPRAQFPLLEQRLKAFHKNHKS